MTPVWQVMIGMGIGIISALGIIGIMLNRQPIANNTTRKQYTEYWSEPGQRCPICLDDLESHSMQYLACGHALHDNCYREYRKRSSSCPTCRADF